MQYEQLPFFMAFNALFKLKPVDAARIVEHFGYDAMTAWHSSKEWAQLASLSKAQAEDVLQQRQSVEPERLLNEYLACGCSAVCLGDEDYPEQLAGIYDPPLILFFRGSLPAKEDICIAMVGSRKATSYGTQVADIFSRDLAAQGVVVVSGMARGIDSVCHRGAIATGGRTIAVLGSGIDVIYPPENGKLYADICDNGAVVSEFPIGMPALAINFPRRNRIISGLSNGVVVVEAGEKSGTMRTVSYAAEQGRDVFAVPGNVTSQTSRGVNRMIRDDGVKIALSAADIWKEYSNAAFVPAFAAKTAVKKEQVSTVERQLLQMLQQPEQVDVLLSRPEINLSAAELNSTLMLMEMRGLVRKLPGNYYQTQIKRINA